MNPDNRVEPAQTLAGALGVEQDVLFRHLAEERLYVQRGKGAGRAKTAPTLRKEFNLIRYEHLKNQNTSHQITWFAVVDENYIEGSLHLPEDQLTGAVASLSQAPRGLAPLASPSPPEEPAASKKRGRPKLVRPTVVVDSNDEVSRPTVETDHALRALVMRKLRFTPVLRTIIISGEVPNQRHNARARVYNHTQVNANGNTVISKRPSSNTSARTSDASRSTQRWYLRQIKRGNSP